MRLPLLALALGVATLPPAAMQASAQQRDSRAAHILVGPNILVSRDDNVPRVELPAAAHPRDTALLFGAGIVLGDLEQHTASYVSRDGGMSWTSHLFPQRDADDPIVAFGPTGTVYFA